MKELDFYKNKKVFITGHTGFKGAWLSEILLSLGAEVSGYALEAEEGSLFDMQQLDKRMHSHIGDIRDYEFLKDILKDEKPDIVFHLAAQAYVQDGYENPRGTYETNLMGTVNVLECMREVDSVKSFVNVTTDKVYQNNDVAHKEEDILNGYDPYSNSKSCSELATETYARCFFKDRDIGISTARSGNVIGAGDFGKNRIIPDCVNAYLNNEVIEIRNPVSVRPYYHILDALYGYLLIAEAQYEKKDSYASYNIGPDKDAYINTKDLVVLFIDEVKKQSGKELTYEMKDVDWPKEAEVLMLDNEKIKKELNWKPTLSISKAIEEVVAWTILYEKEEDTSSYIQESIKKYIQ